MPLRKSSSYFNVKIPPVVTSFERVYLYFVSISQAVFLTSKIPSPLTLLKLSKIALFSSARS